MRIQQPQVDRMPLLPGVATDWLPYIYSVENNGCSSYASQQVFVTNSPLWCGPGSSLPAPGEGQIRAATKLEPYPNPVNEILYLDIPDDSWIGAEMILYDLQGNRLFHGQLPDTTTWQLDLTDHASGIYYLRVWKGDQQETIKVVKF